MIGWLYFRDLLKWYEKKRQDNLAQRKNKSTKEVSSSDGERKTQINSTEWEGEIDYIDTDRNETHDKKLFYHNKSFIVLFSSVYLPP